MNITKLKEKARKKLKGKYGIIAPAVLIYVLITFFFSMVSKAIYNDSVDILFNILITGLLYMGLLQISIRIAKGEKTRINELFERTDLFFKSSALTIIITVFTGICYLLFFIASKSLMTFFFNEAGISVMLSAFMIVVGILLCSAIAIFYIILMVSWSQAYYILYDNEEMPVLDILSKSMDLMENYKIDYILLQLSFLGWMILGFMSFGILLIAMVIPYMMVTEANFYFEVKKKDKRKS